MKLDQVSAIIGEYPHPHFGMIPAIANCGGVFPYRPSITQDHKNREKLLKEILDHMSKKKKKEEN